MPPVAPPPYVCVHMRKVGSLLVKGPFHLILFRSFPSRDVCVGKQREAATHTCKHTHTRPHSHIASSAVLNLQAHTHTHGNVRVDHREMRQDSQRGGLFIREHKFGKCSQNKSHKCYHCSQPSCNNSFVQSIKSRAADVQSCLFKSN